MKIKPFRIKLFIILLAGVSVLGSSRLLLAKQKMDAPLDIIVKIGHLDKTLNLIDDLARSDTNQPALSVGSMLRGFLQGTEWIDPDRLIIIGVMLEEPKPEMAVLIPFRHPNPNFQNTFNASAGPNYYVLTLPPGQNVQSNDLETAMVSASKSKIKTTLSVEAAVSHVIQKKNEQIREMLTQLERLPLDQNKNNLPVNPQDIRSLILKMLDTAAQLETLSIGLDINKIMFTSAAEAKALDNSELAALFTRDAKTTLLDEYKPQLQINFRSQRYNMDGVLELVGSTFGPFYEKMGIDFFSLAEIGKRFTGEMAGGISFVEAGIRFEMINVLKRPEISTDFLETVYIPWLMEFNQKMMNILKSQLGEEIEPVFIRTPNSTVDGQTVVGIRTQLPVFPGTEKGPGMGISKGLLKYEVRMAAVGNLILTAPNDQRIKDLIAITKKLRKKPATGALMTIDYDITGYLGAILELIPALKGQNRTLPQMGRVNMQLDMKDGRAYTRSSILTEDINTLIRYFKNMTPLSQQKKSVTKAPDKKKTVRKAPQKERGIKQVANIPEKDETFWVKKGAYNATYGHDKAALKQFQKAIELNPNSDHIHFQQGISYGEIGKYDNAISSINRAISLNSQDAHYYYGRGRVFLLSGQKSKALADFKHAAALGDRDAQRYLKRTAGTSEKK